MLNYHSSMCIEHLNANTQDNMALDDQSRNWLISWFGKNVKFDEPMSRHTSLRIGGPAEAYITPETTKDLISIVKWSLQIGIPYLIVGDGTNLLVKDGGIRGIVIVLKKCLDKITRTAELEEDVVVTAEAGARMSALCRFAITRGLEGMNFALGIPGSVGGGIMMNAGTSHGWVENVLDSITVLEATGRIREITREKLDFSYRSLSWPGKENLVAAGQPVILNGCFRLKPSDSVRLKEEAEAILEKRRKNQPVDLPSAGCFFKNPAAGKTAGQLVELAGLKGKTIGDAEISTKHANFIINRGKASAADCLALMVLVQETVSEKFNINLEAEVQIVGS
ncbi:UDP-N-acetylmuramate dehydrogenase [Thermodesulfobacteriota bacterium]